MDIGAVAGQEVAHVMPESTQADLFLQAQGAGLPHKVFSARPLAEDIEAERSSGSFGFSQDIQQEPVILDQIKVSDGNQISERLLARLGQAMAPRSCR